MAATLHVTLDVAAHLVEDLGEVGRSVQLGLLESILVRLHNTLNTIDAGIKDITVQSEAVSGTCSVRRNGAAEAVQVDHLVCVVELEDVAHVLDRLQVLITARVEVMKRGL